MPRIAIVGGPGTGKSTLAARASAVTGSRHVELDALWWGPGWVPVEPSIFQDRVRAAVDGDSWITEGSYIDEAMRPLVWPRAEMVVWLDLPRHKAVARTLRRSLARIVKRTELWGTNRQGAGVLTPRSIIRFARRWPSYPEAVRNAGETGELDSKKLLRLGTDGEKEAWLRSLGK